MPRLFELDIDDISLPEVRRRVLSSEGVNVVVTPNVQHIVEINRADELFQCYREADIILCDSRIIQLISRWLSKPIHNVIPGSDLTRELLEKILARCDSIMIVGSSVEDVNKLRSMYALEALSHHEPPMGFIDSPEEVERTIEAVATIRPRFLFLAVGFPRQEKLACMLRERLKGVTCTVFCIGASIDFLTGKQQRAPASWQRLRLEWLYRFSRQPRRLFQRYFVQSWGMVPLIVRELRHRSRN